MAHGIRFAQVNLNTPPARVRSSHAKSKSGCDQCKSRRVKCDEKVPICGACYRRGVECSRTKPPEATCGSKRRVARPEPVLHPGSSISSPSTPETSFSPCQTAHSEDEFLQIRLFYHFERETIHTLTIGFDCWRKSIPLAFKYKFLMHALLMTAAAHLSYQDPGNEEYKKAELEHVSCATSGIRDALSKGIHEAQVDAVFASCLLLYNQGWASYEEGLGPNDDLRPALDVDFLVPLGAGLKGILTDIPIFTTLIYSEIFGEAVAFSPKIELMRFVHHTSLQYELEESFRTEYMSLWPTTGYSDAEYFRAYTIECDRLIPILATLRLGCSGLDLKPLEATMARYLYSWPILLSPKFVDMIRRKATCAQLLFWHYYKAVEASVTEKYWWAQKRTTAMIIYLERSLNNKGIQPTNLVADRV